MSAYFVVWSWNGDRHYSKTEFPKRAKPDPTRVRREEERYELTEEQSHWSIATLKEAVGLGLLERYVEPIK